MLAYSNAFGWGIRESVWKNPEKGLNIQIMCNIFFPNLNEIDAIWFKNESFLERS